MPDVDVVIATYNRPQRLQATLASLAAQSFPNFCVYVVDDCSNPPVSLEDVPEAVRNALRIHVLRTPANGGPGAARNLGARAGHAPFIAFIDDDVDAAPTWLEQLVAAAEREPHRVVFGPLLAPAGWRPTPWNAWEAATLLREYRKMRAGIYAPTWRQFFTGNAIVRRADFEAAGGFNERFTRAEDIELALRLSLNGGTFAFEHRAVGWHHAQRTLESWLRIPRDYARFDVAIDHLHPEVDWLRVVDREAGERKRPVRLLRQATKDRRARAGVTTSAIATARSLFAAGATGGALRILSTVYDLEYQASLEHWRHQPAQAVNPASTAPQRDLATVTIESPAR